MNAEVTKQKALEVLDQEFSPPRAKLEKEIDDDLFEEEKEIFGESQDLLDSQANINRKRGKFLLSEKLTY